MALKWQEDENPMHHLFHYSTFCDMLGPKEVAK
jgi:hypothetical protein